MHLSVAVIADHANVAKGEKLNVFGIFDTIWSQKFPMIHPFMVLALRVILTFEDGGRPHKLQIILEDEDGRDFLRAEAAMNPMKIAAGAVVSSNIVLNFAGLRFQRASRYGFKIIADGTLIATVPLTVVEGPPPPQVLGR
jgi:hypothetical protein